jgi:hypothetical protein
MAAVARRGEGMVLRWRKRGATSLVRPRSEPRPGHSGGGGEERLRHGTPAAKAWSNFSGVASIATPAAAKQASRSSANPAIDNQVIHHPRADQLGEQSQELGRWRGAESGRFVIGSTPAAAMQAPRSSANLAIDNQVIHHPFTACILLLYLQSTCT